MTLPDPGTDPIPEHDLPPYGFLARLIGLPVLEARLLDRFEQLLSATAADTAALEAARATLTAADQTIDRIEPAPLNHSKRTHTGHRDGNPGASKKGTNP